MAERVESTFSLRYAVKRTIAAPAELVWEKLTDARGFTKWNSTIESLEGRIAVGEKLAIRLPIAPGRTFTPKVTELVPHARMVWQDGFYPMFQGTRTFTLTQRDARTEFEMVELFRGLMLPMIRASLPDFRAQFERYAADLQAACTAPTR